MIAWAGVDVGSEGVNGGIVVASTGEEVRSRVGCGFWGRIRGNCWLRRGGGGIHCGDGGLGWGCVGAVGKD